MNFVCLYNTQFEINHIKKKMNNQNYDMGKNTLKIQLNFVNFEEVEQFRKNIM